MTEKSDQNKKVAPSAAFKPVANSGGPCAPSQSEPLERRTPAVSNGGTKFGCAPSFGYDERNRGCGPVC